MRRPVSPVFAVIVIVLAIAFGAVWFLFRLRSYDAARAREAAFMQAQAEAQMRSGKRGQMEGRRGRARSSARSGAEPGRGGPASATMEGASRRGAQGGRIAPGQPGAAGGAAATTKPGAASRQPVTTTQPTGK